ncbi:hypothetical protein [Actinomadura sp. B10D3]|uniref:hypothetical protein n=1 Tax=Actinomadura sp. B10D3 TaxID=3153557 RepID=UPI00325E0AE2
MMERPGRRTLAHHIAADVDRASPLFARILLVRAIWNLRHRRGDHSLWVAKDVASDCPEALRTVGWTARESTRVLVPGHDADHDLTTAVTGADRLSSAVRREGDAYARYQLATDPDISIDKKRAGELGDEWQDQRGHVRDALHELPSDLGSGRTGSLLLDRALDRVFKRGLYYQTRHYLFSREPERAWRGRVAGVLQDAARVRGGPAPAGDLADSVREGRRAFDGAAPDTWARHAAVRLEEVAMPVIDGREPLTAGKVTAIRLAALCLSCEVDGARTRAADPFRGIITGITLMERAAVGQGHGGPP